NLYNHPINLFVASFIGSPPMNLLDARLVSADGVLAVEGRGFSLRVPIERANGLDPYVGEEVVVAIRPEHLFDRDEVDSAPEGSSLSAQVDLVEPLGSETLIHALVANQPLTARASADSELRRG